MPTIASILSDYAALSISDQNAVKSALLSPSVTGSLSMSQFVEQKRFAGGRVCPICGCTHVIKNGHEKNGTQRFLCLECGKSFVITTNSIASHTRKPVATWEKFIDCMLRGLSIRQSATECGISNDTALHGGTRFWMPCSRWLNPSSWTDSLKQTKHSFLYPIKAIILKELSECHESHTSVDT